MLYDVSDKRGILRLPGHLHSAWSGSQVRYLPMLYVRMHPRPPTLDERPEPLGAGHDLSFLKQRLQQLISTEPDPHSHN